MNAVEVKNLRRSFGGIKAVAGVSLAVEPGEIVGIIGPNGSGKSTLFSLLSGTIAPSSGVINLLGRDVTRMPAYRIARLGLGRTFQIPTPFTNMTVRENLLAAAVEGDWKAARSRADEVLEALEIAHVADDLAGTLSGGQLRLLEFGRVQMRDAQIFLLDEVTAGVNPRLRQIILSRVRALRERGKTFLIIEHDMELVRSVCERIIVMDFGEIVFEGAFEDVAANELVIDAYLGRPSRVTRLAASDVVAGYGAVEILHGVSVEAGDGEVTCIFGPNGCGKSTLLGAIAGTVNVWSGDVDLDGERLAGRPAHAVLRSGLALMPQGGGVFPQLSVRENLRVGGHTLTDRRLLEERIGELVDEFPRLGERMSVMAGSLSGGEQIMLAIARALIVKPRFILFDEPSAGLSPKLAAEALNRVAALAERGVGVLMVEQNIREALRVASRIYVLVGGRNRFAGRPEDIANGRQLMDIYLGGAADEEQRTGEGEIR